MTRLVCDFITSFYEEGMFKIVDLYFLVPHVVELLGNEERVYAAAVQSHIQCLHICAPVHHIGLGGECLSPHAVELELVVVVDSHFVHDECAHDGVAVRLGHGLVPREGEVGQVGVDPRGDVHFALRHEEQSLLLQEDEIAAAKVQIRQFRHFHGRVNHGLGDLSVQLQEVTEVRVRTHVLPVHYVLFKWQVIDICIWWNDGKGRNI